MDHQLCVLLHSKYSPSSTQLMNALESSPVNLTATVGLQLVCIDNEEIRAQIYKSNKVDISTVPCVMIIYGNGGVEKYEGVSAFQWIEETVRKHMPAPPPQVQMPPQPPPQVRHQSPPQEPPRRRRRPRREEPEPYDEEYESSENDYRPPSPKPRRPRHRAEKSSKPLPPKPKPVASTSIEDLDSESDETPIPNIPPRPPASIRTGPSGYDLTSEFGEPQETNRDMSSRMKQSTEPATGQGNNLMATAMAMQKERESGTTHKPVGGPPPNQRPI